MNKKKFSKITANTKIPIIFRKRLVLNSCITILVIFSYLSISNSNFLPLYITSIVIVGMSWIYCYQRYKDSLRNRLVQFIWDNGLYVDESSSAEISYQINKEQIVIRFHKNGDLFTEKSTQYGKHFEAITKLPLKERYNTMTHCDYIFDRLSDKRLKFNEKDVKDNVISLTKKISWEFSKPCHTIICGGTNSGKTYLTSILIIDYLKIRGQGGGSEIYVCDPKGADIAFICRRIDLKKYGKVQNLAVSDNEMAKMLRELNQEMEKRYANWFNEDKNVFGKTWKDIPSAKPIVLIIDEFSAILATANPKVAKEISNYFTSLLLKGRMVGIEIVLIMQRPDISSNGINGLTGQQRDQFGIRIGMGNMTKDGRKMLFGNTESEFLTINEIGSGYIMIDGRYNSPIYFEAPLLPKEHGDYLDHLDKAIELNLA